MIHLVPGDPVSLYGGDFLSVEEQQELLAELGLDRAIPVQYVQWAYGVLQGDFGRSLISDIPVSRLVGQSWAATTQLAVAAAFIAAAVAIVSGSIAAERAGRAVDWVISSWNALQISVPGFWVGIVSILLFSLVLGWLPAGGYVPLTEDPVGALRHLVLPATVLGISVGAVLSRFSRSTILETLSEDYIQTAYAKGASSTTALRSHALPNALVPIVTVFGIQFGHLLGGTIILEKVFSWPGLGTLVVTGVSNRDYTVVQGSLLVLVVVFIVVNLVVDVAYGLLDPRIRSGAAKQK